MNYHKLSSIQNDLASGQITVESLVKFYLQNIEDQKDINAFLEVWGEESLAKAELIQQKIKQGTAGKLAGLVIGIKDNISYKGHKVSSSSKILQGFEAVYSATVVERLLAEDAIIIGRLNCDEFAMGSSNETSYYGKVLNPVDKERVPGGSSGGSAAAVKANLCHITLGSDTGGSIRQPASFVGVVGYKPSYGVVSRHGLLSYASSFDQIGPFTKSVEDVNVVMDVIKGKDEFDSTLYQKDIPSSSEVQVSKTSGKIAYLKDCFDSEGLDAEIKQEIEKVFEKLRSIGFVIEPVSFPYLDYLIPTYYVLTTAEASANLSRYDGIRFGYRSKNAEGVNQTYVASRTEGFGEEVKRRIMLGSFVLCSGYYDAYYGKAQKVRRIIKNKTEEIFENYDYVITPTCPDVAFKFGENSDDPIAMYLQDIFTVQANIAGNAAISLPMTLPSNKLPFGIQIMSSMYKDAELLNFAEWLEEDVLN